MNVVRVVIGETGFLRVTARALGVARIEDIATVHFFVAQRAPLRGRTFHRHEIRGERVLFAGVEARAFQIFHRRLHVELKRRMFSEPPERTLAIHTAREHDCLARTVGVDHTSPSSRPSG